MNKPRVVIFIQARVGSTRLPGKVLRKVLGKELLLLMIERVKKAKTIGEVVVITSVNPQDNLIVDLCKRHNITYYCGSETDLLDRHYQAAIKFRFEVVSKIPSDCPLIDPEVIDRVIKFYLDNQEHFDYVSNLHPPTYPDGQDVEVCPLKILEVAWKNARKPYEREHTFPYIWDNPEKFRIGNVEMEKGKNLFMSERWVLDYKEDFEFIKRVYEELYVAGEAFSTEDILNLLERKKELKDINKHLRGVTWYRNHLNELKTINKNLAIPDIAEKKDSNI